VQTLYVAGEPAVSRTTLFDAPPVLDSRGPVEMLDGAASEGIVRWYHSAVGPAPSDAIPSAALAALARSSADHLLLRPASATLAVNGAKPKSSVEITLVPDEPPTPSRVGQPNQDKTGAMRMPSLAAPTPGEGVAARAAGAPGRCHVAVVRRTRNSARGAMCGGSSMLIMPVEVAVPDSYGTNGALTRLVRWTVSRVDAEPVVAGRAVRENSTELWAGRPFRLGEIAGTSVLETEVHTPLSCDVTATHLLRLQLIWADPKISSGATSASGGAGHALLCSDYFCPALVLAPSAPASLGPEPLHAWATHRALQSPH
jgi:hypothetical protein